MELLSFYLGSIIASILLLLTLGLIGYHLTARGQSLEVLLVGQEFQTSILLAAFLVSILPHLHYDHHGIHLEILFTLILTILFHVIFKQLFRHRSHIKTEGVVGAIIILMGLNQLVVLISPLIEMHMVKSFIGDIVTVSKAESYFVSILSFIAFITLIKKNNVFYEDSLEISLFGKVTKKRGTEVFFNTITLIMMLFSVHHFGVLFTLGAILIPGLINSYFRLTKKDLFIQLFLGAYSPVLAFILTTYNDRLPTTVLILFIMFGINIVFGFIRRLK